MWLTKRAKQKLEDNGWEQVPEEAIVIPKKTFRSLRSIAAQNGYESSVIHWGVYETEAFTPEYHKYDDTRLEKWEQDQERLFEEVITFFGLDKDYLVQGGGGSDRFIRDIRQAAQAEAVAKATERLNKARKAGCEPDTDKVE